MLENNLKFCLKEDQLLDFILDGEIRIFCTSIVVVYYYYSLAIITYSWASLILHIGVELGRGGRGKFPWLSFSGGGGGCSPLKTWRRLK